LVFIHKIVQTHGLFLTGEILAESEFRNFKNLKMKLFLRFSKTKREEIIIKLTRFLYLVLTV